MEKDDEITGNGNIYTAEFWEYDARTGRRWNIDPVMKPWESPYMTFGANPILNVDPKGNDWFVNKQTGNVVFVKGSSKVPSMYGDNKNWENLGKDNMFDKGGKDYSKKYSQMYFDAKSAETFMNAQGYEKGDRLVMQRTTYVDKSPDGNIGENITTTIVDDVIKSKEITYVTPDKFGEEKILDKGTPQQYVKDYVTKTVDKVQTVEPSESSQNKSSGKGGFSGFGKSVVEGIKAILKKKH